MKQCQEPCRCSVPESLKMGLEVLFNLIGMSTMSFEQANHGAHSNHGYTAGGREQGVC